MSGAIILIHQQPHLEILVTKHVRYHIIWCCRKEYLIFTLLKWQKWGFLLPLHCSVTILCLCCQKKAFVFFLQLIVISLISICELHRLQYVIVLLEQCYSLLKDGGRRKIIWSHQKPLKLIHESHKDCTDCSIHLKIAPVLSASLGHLVQRITHSKSSW